MFHSICSIRSAAPAPRPPAAPRKRPAPTGRALSCAAVYASEPQGITATHERNDARNRAPVTPVSPHISDVSAQRKIRGSQEGDKKPYWCLIPLLSPPPDGGIPRPPKAATITPCHGEKPPSWEGHRRLQRQAAGTAEGLPSAEGKEEKEAGTYSHFSQTSGQYPTVACLPFRTTGVFISVPSSSSFSFLSSS